MTDPYRQQLLEQFLPDPSDFLPQAYYFTDLHLGTTFNIYPKKSELRMDSTEKIVQGWQPEHPIIGPDTRVIALGSCFASSFILWLADQGFNRQQPVSPYNTL